ncbi:MAG: PDZ domain-containing protein [Brachybacterium sp.]|nr:PDZ domain-containing protein [Brachybacterium sp.]
MTASPSVSARPSNRASTSAPAYLRYPDVRGDLVVFTAADDVWAVPLAGGHAWRLSNDAAPVSYPRISPDGSQVAFVSHLSGAPEVHLVDVDGAGEARRLTHWANRYTRVAGWLPDGRIIVTTGHGAVLTTRDAQLWALGTDGAATLLPFGRGSDVAIHPGGTTVVTTMWRKDMSTWKHYQGGTAPKLWISREALALDAPHAEHAERAWEPLLDEILAPKTRAAFYGDRLLFASDTPGEGAALTDRATSNLWSVAIDGTDLRSHTRLTSAEGYLREPATDGEHIVFTSRGRLFAMDSLEDEPREVPVAVGGVASGRRTHPAAPTKNLLAVRPLFDGRASVVEWRGSVHLLTHRGGPARRLAGTCGLRLREARALGRSPFAVFVSDSEAQHDRTGGGVGSDTLHLTRLDGQGEEIVLDIGDVGRILHAVPSPDGSRIAISTYDNVVRVVHLLGVTDPATSHATESIDPEPPRLDRVREVGRSTGGEVSDLAFSPDGRFLVWSEPASWLRGRLMISEVDEPDPSGRALTSGLYKDTCPVFTADGKHLAFISARTFETAYDDMVFDLGFVSSQRPHLVPLEARTRDPFGPDADGWTLAGADAAGASAAGAHPGAGASDGASPSSAQSAAVEQSQALTAPASADSATGADGAKAPPRTTIDLEGIDQRIVPFPVESGYISSLRATALGLAWLRHPQQGVLGSARAGVEGDAPKPSLELWNLAERKLHTLAEGVDAFEVTGDGAHLVLRQGEKVVLVPADRTVEDEDPAKLPVDLERLRLMVDPVAERRGMLWDNYRIMAQQFWRADMDGQDWHAMTSWYDETIDRVVTDDDFRDLMWEVLAELGTSHAYVMGAPYAPASPGTPGLLGADLERRGNQWVIARILDGESSDPDARSPLRAPGVAAAAGDAIVQVDGRDVDAARGVPPLLIGSADRPTELVLERDGERRRVVVVPLKDDGQLRYQNWVASRRAHVTEQSDGRLGYLHVPDMMSSGWAQMHRDLRDASTREGIVVDVRYNSGGHTSQLVTDRLARRVVSWGYPRHESPDTYPAFAPRGPVVLVTNQEAGSDGDIVNAVSQALGIGTVVGTRTWGGVIGIDGRFDLVDGTGVTQPKYASWFEGVDWGIENYGVDPDIEVPFPPNLWVAGEDPQLDRGISEALAALEQNPAAVAPPLPPARFGPEKG